MQIKISKLKSIFNGFLWKNMVKILGEKYIKHLWVKYFKQMLSKMCRFSMGNLKFELYIEKMKLV